MKTIYKTTAFALAISLIMASCSTKLTISKRHYKKGYYVSLTKKQNTSPSNAWVSTKHNVPIPTKVEKEKIETTVVLNTTVKKSDINSDKEKPKTKEKNKSIKTEKISTNENNFTYIYPEKKQQLGMHNRHESSMRGSDEGHSLLWIVVVVLIILWALGIISGSFGLGVLINLLLVIAFVLLILWLLRII